MGRFSRGGSFIPEERACFLPLDFAVVAGGKAVGGVGFVLGTDVERFGAKIGFWLSSRCRGRGMMTAAVRQAVEWMFANTPIIRIFAAAYATNSASQRVLESRVPACRDVPQGFFQERGVRGRLLLRITERRK